MTHTQYPGKVNSPVTTITSDISANITHIPVADLSVFPTAPNLAVLGTGEDAETVLYTHKTAATGAGELAGCTRGFEGTAKAWTSGESAARNFCQYDLEAIQDELIQGPGAAVDNGVVTFDGVGGLTVQDSGVTLVDNTTGLTLTNSTLFGTLELDTTYVTFSNGVYKIYNGDGGFVVYDASTGYGFTIDGSGNFSDLVRGPASAVSGNLPTFDGATGKLIADSGIYAESDTAEIYFESSDGVASLTAFGGDAAFVTAPGFDQIIVGKVGGDLLTIDETATLSEKQDCANNNIEFYGDDLTLTQDNGGYERFFYKDDASNNLASAYTLTGTPVWAGGSITVETTEKFIKALPTTGATQGKWDSILKFNTAYAADQSANLYIGATSYMAVMRKGGNAIQMKLVVNAATLIATQNAGATLADETSGNFYVTYDTSSNGTAYYRMWWNGTGIGAATAGSVPVTPSLGLLATGSTIGVGEIGYYPSLAYSEPFSVDDETRYMQLVSTDITFPATTGTWAAAAAGDVVVTTGSTLMTLASADDEAICTAFRSYNFGSGEIELSFDCNNDGGGGADETGWVFGYQDILNHYKLVIHDSDGAGTAENLQLWKVVAGVATQLGSSKDVTARYAKGTRVYLKLQWDAERGQMWAYLKDNTGGSSGLYPTTPDISNAFSAQFMYGKVGPYAAVTTAGAGNLNVDYYPWTVRAKLLIGETNVPATETGFYFRDEFGADSSGRISTSLGTGITLTGTGGKLIISGNSANGMGLFTSQTQDVTLEADISSAATGDTAEILYLSTQPASTTTGNPYNGYMTRCQFSGAGAYFILRKYVAGSGTNIATATKTITAGQTYHVKSVITISSGVPTFNLYFDNEGSPSITYTDSSSPYSYGYFGVRSALTGASSGTFDNLTISGTRYYMKPMLRGAGLGENADGYCTRFVVDGNWDQSGEFTAVGGAATWAVNEGSVQFTGANDGLKTLPKWTSQVITAAFSTTTLAANAPTIVFLDDGNDGGSFGSVSAGSRYLVYVSSADKIRVRRVVSGSTTLLGEYTVPTLVANKIYTLQVVYMADTGSISVYLDGALVGTATDTSITTANPAGFGTTGFSSGSVKFSYFSVNGLMDGATDGVAATLGGVPHGARYDMQESVTGTITNAAKYGEYTLDAVLETTNDAADWVQLYYYNGDDSTYIDTSNNNNTLQVPVTEAFTDLTKNLVLQYRDRDDDITVAVRRSPYNGVAADNQAAVFLEVLAMLPKCEM